METRRIAISRRAVRRHCERVADHLIKSIRRERKRRCILSDFFSLYPEEILRRRRMNERQLIDLVERWRAARRNARVAIWGWFFDLINRAGLCVVCASPPCAFVNRIPAQHAEHRKIGATTINRSQTLILCGTGQRDDSSIRSFVHSRDSR